MIIGIDGLGGAGKTSMAKELQEIFKEQGISSEVLHIDDFIHPREKRYVDGIEEWRCYYDLQWRYDYITSLIRSYKKKGRFSGSIEIYNKETDCYDTRMLEIELKDVLIIEGVFLQRKEMEGSFDFVIYIDVPEQERLRRVLKRDTYIGNESEIEEKYRKRYFPAEEYYVKVCRPKEKADFCLNALFA